VAAMHILPSKGDGHGHDHADGDNDNVVEDVVSIAASAQTSLTAKPNGEPIIKENGGHKSK